MSVVTVSAMLTTAALQRMLSAAVDAAEAENCPECIVIVDASGVDLASLRMSGARFASLASARAKAVTAASNRTPSGSIPVEFAAAVASATGGAITNLRGGLPIVSDGHLVGAIGVGSGSPDQDVRVANAALKAIGAATFD